MPEHIRVWRTAGFRGIELQRGVGVTRRVPPHWHDEYHLCLVHGGAGELFYRGVHHANPPWSLFIVHPGEIHSNRATVERGCDFRTINAAPEILEQAAEAVGYQRRALPFFPRAVVLDHEALLRFQRLHEALEHPAARLEREALLLETFAHLVRRYAQDAPTPGKDGREPQGVRRVRDYLEASFADEIPLQRLAAIARLSPYYLNRAFRRAFGLPPHAFQTQLRLAEARKLLRQGELPATVAAETGFADQSHLTRRFKTVVGVTPGAYRKNVQDRNPCARYFRGMKTTALFLSISAAAAVHADDFSKDRWRFRGPTANVEEKLGRSSLFLRGTHAYLNDVAFADGTIDVDVAVPRQRNFVGVLFRVASEGSQERVYLRPHKSGLDDALQYEANFDQSSTWQLFSAPGYMRPADIPWEQWFHVRLVISGSQATVFLHGSETPALVVKDLKRGYARGGIGLYAGSGGAWFSNLRYQPAKGSAPPAPSAPPSFAKGVVQAWELSESFAAESALPEALPTIANWDRVAAEEPGLLVIDRYRKSSGTLPPSFDFEKRLGPAKGRRVVYARAVVQSDREQVKRLSFGYSDEVCVFVNGRIVFTGRSAFRFRDPGFMGVLDVDDDAVYLPLRKGRNELVMAVAEYFGGWGVAARFDDPSGLTVP